MKAEIMAVGTELLLGDILNTNAQFLSKELALLGIDVYFQTVVGDNPDRILKAFEIGFSRADIIIITGGLGPTDDDLTKEIAAKYFNKSLYMDNKTLAAIESRFNTMNICMTDNNKKQALIPDGAIILDNDKGTAPGIIIEENNKIAILLPGPPFEAKNLYYKSVAPYLAKKQNSVFVSKRLRLCGIGESAAENEIKDLIDKQSNPSIAPYASFGEMNFRITAKANTEAEALKLIEPTSQEIYNRLGKYIYAEGETSLSQTVVNLLKAKHFTIALAESCTGGLITSKLTDIAGVSSVLLEGCVTYSNEAKIKRLGVSLETLNKYGAVSEETAKEMAIGIAKTAGSTIGLSVTGIAGPDGGTEEKPVGLVYIGLCVNGRTIVNKYNVNGDRNAVRQRTVIHALNMLRMELI